MAGSERQRLAHRLQRAVKRRREIEDRLLAVDVPSGWALRHGASLDVPELETVADELLEVIACCLREVSRTRTGIYLEVDAPHLPEHHPSLNLTVGRMATVQLLLWPCDLVLQRPRGRGPGAGGT
jgi:hypothetical protein